MQVKKIALALLVIAGLVGYSFAMKHSDDVNVSARTSSSGDSVKTLQTASGSGSTPPSSSQSTAAASYKDGTYTGSQADAFYGNIQVQVSIASGKITDIQFLQYPNDRRESQQINRQAMPLLKEQALQAQSAHVDGVSGATDTSQAFVESLTAALSKAS